MSRAGENRLGSESSPYLRQHKDNPVDWWPWGAAPFVRAQAEDRPILLSIGYSACHWCHVMAHESFEDAETAAQMNRDFINIKVDREEHPDVDQLYQQAHQLLAEGGGWPLTMFLLPSGEPFFGGTYYPPEDRYGRPSFRRILTALAAAYRDERAKVLEYGQKLLDALREVQQQASGTETSAHLPSDLVQRVAGRLGSQVDRREGGFGHAPKFPNPTALGLLLRSYFRSGEVDDLRPALLTLNKMAQGGIYDHLGGGFARYSTDDKWLVPHFEKMLYDNALLVRLYAQAKVLLDAFNKVGRDFSKPTRNYDAWTLRVNKRFARNWLVTASYTYSRLLGNYDGFVARNTGAINIGASTQYDIPDLIRNSFGPLFDNRPHIAKIDGFYTFDLRKSGRLTLGASLRYQSGTPISLYVDHNRYQGQFLVYVLPRGAGGRIEPSYFANLSISYAYPLPGELELEFTARLANLTNNKAVLRVDEVYSFSTARPIAGGDLEDRQLVVRPGACHVGGRVHEGRKRSGFRDIHAAKGSNRA